MSLLKKVLLVAVVGVGVLFGASVAAEALSKAGRR